MTMEVTGADFARHLHATVQLVAKSGHAPVSVSVAPRVWAEINDFYTAALHAAVTGTGPVESAKTVTEGSVLAINGVPVYMDDRLSLLEAVVEAEK
jgi:hypothetical protein